MRIANNLNMNNARLLNAAGLSDASGNVVMTGTTGYTAVADYPALLALGTPAALTIVLVGYDSNKGQNNTEYHLWPNGIRRYVSTASDQASISYTQTGTIIDDGGGPYSNDANYASSKVFDGSAGTFYNSAADLPMRYVGRNLGSAKTLNQATLLPRQDPSLANRINSAQLQVSTDGLMWTTVYTVSGVNNSNYNQVITVNFASVSTQYIRLYWPMMGNEGNVAEMTISYVY